MSTHHSTHRGDVVTDEDIDRAMLSRGYSHDATTRTSADSIRSLFPNATDDEIERVQREHGRDRSGVRIAAIAKTLGRAPFGRQRAATPTEDRATRQRVVEDDDERTDALASAASIVERAQRARDEWAANAWRTPPTPRTDATMDAAPSHPMDRIRAAHRMGGE